MHQQDFSRVEAFRGAPVREMDHFVMHKHADYRCGSTLPEGVVCPMCHASVRGGQWQWLEAAPAGIALRCPACRRIDDDFPAGFVSVEGDYFERHRVELMNLLQTCANRAAAKHPLRRLMGASDTPEGVLLRTTDTHLAHQFGTALRDAYGGAVNFRYESDDEMLRVHWAR